MSGENQSNQEETSHSSSWVEKKANSIHTHTVQSCIMSRLMQALLKMQIMFPFKITVSFCFVQFCSGEQANIGPMQGISAYVSSQHWEVCALLFAISMWVLLPPKEFVNIKVLWYRTSCLSSLCEKTWKSSHWQLSLLKLHFLLSNWKTLSV